MDQIPLYRRLVDHYRSAIATGSLVAGDRFPSIRVLMARHNVSLSTILQVCRQLESDGLLEARPRSGNFVRQPRRPDAHAFCASANSQLLDPAQYVGIHARVSEFIARCRQHPVRINFSRARGAPNLYPGEALKNAAIRALRHNPEVLVNVGPHNGNAGFHNLLAKRAMDSGMLVAPENIIVTQGCIEALNLALRALTQAGDIVAVESPTFYGLLQILEGLGLRALEIPTSPETGISIDAFAMATRIYPEIKALVVIPHLQNPLGSIMPDAEKGRLVEFCATSGIALIEDDTYSALCDDETPRRALKAWDHSGNVIHCASLHKILAPGMRLGWLAGGRWQARVAMFKHSQTHYNEELSQLAAADFMASSAYYRHLRQLRRTLRDNRRRMAAAIAAYFPQGTRVNHPNGGLTLWVELADRLASQKLFEMALTEGILIAPGLLFSNSHRCEHFVRLNCGWPYTEDVDRAVKRLGELCEHLLQESRNCLSP